MEGLKYFKKFIDNHNFIEDSNLAKVNCRKSLLSTCKNIGDAKLK